MLGKYSAGGSVVKKVVKWAFSMARLVAVVKASLTGEKKVGEKVAWKVIW